MPRGSERPPRRRTKTCQERAGALDGDPSGDALTSVKPLGAHTAGRAWLALWGVLGCPGASGVRGHMCLWAGQKQKRSRRLVGPGPGARAEAQSSPADQTGCRPPQARARTRSPGQARSGDGRRTRVTAAPGGRGARNVCNTRIMPKTASSNSRQPVEKCLGCDCPGRNGISRGRRHHPDNRRSARS